MTTIDLSIIIISFNTKKITLNCLTSVVNSLKNSKIIYEIIVVDNGSKDNSLTALKKFQQSHPQLKLIKNKNNLGFGPANNQAVKIAKGKYLLLLNSDTIILNQTIEKLFNFYKKNEDKIHFLGPKLLNKDLTDQPSAARFFSLPVVFAALFLRGDYWGLTRFSPHKFRQVDWISGACILTKKYYYQKLGGFDEKIFMYMEEVDLLYRAKKQGYQTFFYPEARVIHLSSASSERKTYPIVQVYKGLIFFYRKHSTPLAFFFLKLLLKLKALVALLIGKVAKNQYLINTYEQAYKIVSLAR